MKNEKPFKTYDELISLLESRGIDFSNPESKSFTKKKLQRIGYYNLINGYSSLFQVPGKTDTYLPETTVEQIYNLFLFDRKLRQILLQNILPLETNIKSLIAYHFPKHHPDPQYLIYDNFDTTQKNCQKNIMDLLAEIQRQIAGRVTDPSISHYIRKYGYVPLWVLNNILTLGTISKFYSLMLQNERQDIAKTFHVSDNDLISILTYVSAIRNFCAHGNRLYCYRSKRPLCDTIFHTKAGIPRNPSNEYLYGKRDLFAVLIALKLTLPKDEFRRLVKDIDVALKNLSNRLYVIDIKIVLSAMGFPENWKELLLIKL